MGLLLTGCSDEPAIQSFELEHTEQLGWILALQGKMEPSGASFSIPLPDDTDAVEIGLDADGTGMIIIEFNQPPNTPGTVIPAGTLSVLRIPRGQASNLEFTVKPSGDADRSALRIFLHAFSSETGTAFEEVSSPEMDKLVSPVIVETAATLLLDQKVMTEFSIAELEHLRRYTERAEQNDSRGGKALREALKQYRQSRVKRLRELLEKHGESVP